MSSPAASVPSVAIVDVGSNSIKLLVAAAGAAGGIDTLLSRTIDARISRGISRERPVLGEEGMAVGLAAIGELVADARRCGAARIELVATSAVRSAANGGEFAARVHAATGLALRVLSGDEEANLIGRGLLVDPALAGFSDFYVFDLGGGSLECLHFRGQRIHQALSLPLGCVRLTERFVAHPELPVRRTELDAIAAHVSASLAQSGFGLDGVAPAVFAGGSMTTARAIRAAALGRELLATSPVMGVPELAAILERCAALPFPERPAALAGLPASRADVYPAALATILAIARAGRFQAFHHSFYNLRYGLASDLLASARKLASV